MRLSFFHRSCWAVVVGVLGFFLVTEIGLSPTRTIETDFFQPQRSFSALGPPTRVDGYDTAQSAMRVVAEPVYVDVRVPRLSRFLSVTLWADNGPVAAPAVGVEEDGAVVALTPLRKQTSENGYAHFAAMLDITNAKKTDGAIRLAFSLQGAAPAAPVFLHRLRVTATRPSIAQLFSSLWKR